jgi:hypothetical protein
LNSTFIIKVEALWDAYSKAAADFGRRNKPSEEVGVVKRKTAEDYPSFSFAAFVAVAHRRRQPASQRLLDLVCVEAVSANQAS